MNNKKGIIYALITSVISGVAIFYSKMSLVKIDPLTLATTRNLFVGILFFAAILFFTKFKEIRKLSKNQILKLISIGIIGGAIPFYLFFTGLQIVGAQSANLIHKSLFIWVTLLAVIFLKEKINRNYIFVYFLIIIGTYISMPIKFALNIGGVMVFAATLMWAVENIVAKKILKDVSSELVGLFRMGIGGLILFTISLMTGKTANIVNLNINQIVPIIIGGTILCYYVYFWYKALKFAPASLVALVLSFSIVVGNLLNVSLAGIKLTQNEIYSTGLIGAGIISVILLNYGQTGIVALRKIFSRS